MLCIIHLQCAKVIFEQEQVLVQCLQCRGREHTRQLGWEGGDSCCSLQCNANASKQGSVQCTQIQIGSSYAVHWKGHSEDSCARYLPDPQPYTPQVPEQVYAFVY